MAKKKQEPEVVEGIHYRFEDGDTVISYDGEEYYLSNVLRVPSSDDDIEAAMGENPVNYMKWSIVSAECEGLERALKEHIGYTDALLDDIIREEWAKAHPGERCTDTYVKAQITKRTEHINAVNDHIDASITADIVKSFVRAFEQRHHLLLSINANAREEYRQTAYTR